MSALQAPLPSIATAHVAAVALTNSNCDHAGLLELKGRCRFHFIVTLLRVFRTLCDGRPPPSPSRKSNHHVGSRAWTRGVGRLPCSAEASGGRERALRTPAGTSPAPPGVVASLRPLAASHKVRKTHIYFRGHQASRHQAPTTSMPERYARGIGFIPQRRPEVDEIAVNAQDASAKGRFAQRNPGAQVLLWVDFETATPSSPPPES